MEDDTHLHEEASCQMMLESTCQLSLQLTDKSDAHGIKINRCQDVREADVPDALLSRLLSKPNHQSTDSFASIDCFQETSLSGDQKQFDTSHSDGMEEAAYVAKQISSQPEANFSRNLLSERERRKRFNEALYSLRAILPKISKMDKASIVGDAIAYVRELQAQVAHMTTEIGNLPWKEYGSEMGCGKHGAEVVKPGIITNSSANKERPQHKVTEASDLYLDVINRDQGTIETTR